MVPQNLMEEIVRESLDAHQRSAADAEGVCWCALCTADIQALALSALPPLYVTRREGFVAKPTDSAQAAREEIARAVRHVGVHPKHPEGTLDASEVSVVNLTFEVGFELIEERMRAHANTCDCWECRCDAVAFALNRFPPQYGVSISGKRAYPESSRRQLAEEMVSFIDLGLRITTAVPRHHATA